VCLLLLTGRWARDHSYLQAARSGSGPPRFWIRILLTVCLFCPNTMRVLRLLDQTFLKFTRFPCEHHVFFVQGTMCAQIDLQKYFYKRSKMLL